MLSAPKQSISWGAKGHKIIVEIASRYLNEQTKKNILAYLDGMTIEDASCWMDQVRGVNAYDRMRPYHYADFVRDEVSGRL